MRVRTTTCASCGGSIEVADKRCVLEADERSAAGMKAVLAPPARPPLSCSACSFAVAFAPTVAVWVDRRSRVLLCEGGPWTDGRRAVDVWPTLAAVEIVAHESETELRAAVVERCRRHLAVFEKAAQELGSDESAWFAENYATVGPELVVAVGLASQKALGEITTATYPDTDETLALVQGAACLALCGRRAEFQLDGSRLQDDLDRVIFPGAVASRTPAVFCNVVESAVAAAASHPLAMSLEAVNAGLHWAAGIDNPRAEPYAAAVFNLEVFATGAGGELPMVAHAVRLNSDFLAKTLNTDVLEQVILEYRGGSREMIVETARRLGHIDLVRHLVPVSTAEWLSKLDPKRTVLVTDRADMADALKFAPLGDGSVVTAAPAADVFISYSSKDRIKAEVIARYLRARGLDTFMDKRTAIGELWQQEIPKAVWSSKVVLVLWSRDALASRWVQAEADVALERNVLLQVLLAPVHIPARVAHVQAGRLEAWSNDDEHPELRRLAAALSARLGRSAPDEPASAVADAGIARQLGYAAVAEAVMDLCGAMAWHSIAPSTEASLAPIAPAYATLKATLALATDEDIHHLLDRVNIPRVTLLAALLGADSRHVQPAFPLQVPFRTVTGTGDETTVDCTESAIDREELLEALGRLPGVQRVEASRLADATSDTMSLPQGLEATLSRHPKDPAWVGEVTLRRARR
jgi:hypothetical protein